MKRTISPDLIKKAGAEAHFSERLSSLPERGPVKLCLNGRDIPVVTLRQVHSSTVRIIEHTRVYDGDALISLSGSWIGVKTADCVPVLGASVVSRAVFAIHAGWRGLIKRIIPATVNTLKKHGISPDALVIAVGPHICPRHYPVGDEVKKRFRKIYPEDVLHGDYLNLSRCVYYDLVESGVREDAITFIDKCTFECPEYASHRREGRTEFRQINFIGRQEPVND